MEQDGIETFLDRIIAEDATAKEPLPPFRASIMDGYAVIASDGIGTYDVIASIRAGVDVPKDTSNNQYDIKPFNKNSCLQVKISKLIQKFHLIDIELFLLNYHVQHFFFYCHQTLPR